MYNISKECSLYRHIFKCNCLPKKSLTVIDSYSKQPLVTWYVCFSGYRSQLCYLQNTPQVSLPMNFTLSFQLYFSCKLSIKGNYSFYFILLVLLVNKLSYPIAISILLRAVLLEYTFVSSTSHEHIFIIYCWVHSHHHMVMLHLVCAINFIFMVNITHLCFQFDLFH